MSYIIMYKYKGKDMGRSGNDNLHTKDFDSRFDAEKEAGRQENAVESTVSVVVPILKSKLDRIQDVLSSKSKVAQIQDILDEE
jgi:hypothetical protein